jgi:hypothetical protein
MRTSRSRTSPARGADGTLSSIMAVDRMIDSYVVWREACARLRSTYEWWFASDVTDVDSRRRAYAVCAAALEQEETAAREYQNWVERLGAPARAVTSTRSHGP